MTEFWARPVVGSTFTATLVENLSRAHIAQYAGAAGDFNLVHVDEPFAVGQAGRPSVIAHGMFTMGLTASFVTSLIGHGTLKRFGGRFLAPVHPGDGVVCTATVSEVASAADGAQVVLAVRTAIVSGPLVFEGSAVAHRPTTPE
jgi:acyl dehydratase